MHLEERGLEQISTVINTISITAIMVSQLKGLFFINSLTLIVFIRTPTSLDGCVAMSCYHLLQKNWKGYILSMMLLLQEVQLGTKSSKRLLVLLIIRRKSQMKSMTGHRSLVQKSMFLGPRFLSHKLSLFKLMMMRNWTKNHFKLFPKLTKWNKIISKNMKKFTRKTKKVTKT